MRLKKKSLSKVKFQCNTGQRAVLFLPWLSMLRDFVAFGTDEPSPLVCHLFDFLHQHWIALWGTHTEIPTVSRSPLELARFLECNLLIRKTNKQTKNCHKVSCVENNSFWLYSNFEPQIQISHPSEVKSFLLNVKQAWGHSNTGYRGQL